MVKSPRSNAHRENGGNQEPGSRREREGAGRRKRGKARRPGKGASWIYGQHAVMAVLANPERLVHRLLSSPEAAARLSPDLPALAGGIRPEHADSRTISSFLPTGAAHQGLAVLTDPLTEPTIEEIIFGLGDRESACIVALDQVTDPGNVGAILRSAAAFGASAVLLPERHGADTTAALAKAASGALDAIPLVRVGNLARALQQLKQAGFWCAGLDAHDGRDITGTDLHGRMVLVLGSEGRGLRRLVAETCDMRIRLPIGGAVESLNVSAATAIALYEWRRHNRPHDQGEAASSSADQ